MFSSYAFFPPPLKRISFRAKKINKRTSWTLQETQFLKIDVFLLLLHPIKGARATQGFCNQFYSVILNFFLPNLLEHCYAYENIFWKCLASLRTGCLDQCKGMMLPQLFGTVPHTLLHLNFHKGVFI